MSDIEVTKILTPYNYTNGTIDRIKYIVIHYVGATGSAKANCNYYASGYIGASAHYYVDFDGSYYQSVEDHNIAWHCGTKNGYKHAECRNANSIGIEMCVRNKGSQADTSKDWYFEKATYEATIKLTKYLMAKYGIDADHVIRHYDVTGKICPNPFVYNHTEYTWEKFKAAISEPDAVSTPVEYYEGWIKAADGVRWWWQRKDGTYPASKWCVINKHWYYFDQYGYMVTGKLELNGKTYLLNDDPTSKFEGACMHETKLLDGSLEVWEVDIPDDI